jgi:hypothetical protein
MATRYIVSYLQKTLVGSATSSPSRRVGYAQDVRYIAIEHRDKVRPGSGREGSLGCVRRDCLSFARLVTHDRLVIEIQNVGNKLPTLRGGKLVAEPTNVFCEYETVYLVAIFDIDLVYLRGKCVSQDTVVNQYILRQAIRKLLVNENIVA